MVLDGRFYCHALGDARQLRPNQMIVSVYIKSTFNSGIQNIQHFTSSLIML